MKTFETVDVNNNGVTDLGDVIRYQFTVINDGNTDIQNISITDNLVAGDSDTVISQSIQPIEPLQIIYLELSY